MNKSKEEIGKIVCDLLQEMKDLGEDQTMIESKLADVLRVKDRTDVEEYISKLEEDLQILKRAHARAN